MSGEFTDTEQKFYEVLKDGQLHTDDELRGCLTWAGPRENIHAHITSLRKKLSQQGKGVLCERGKPTRFRLVEFFTPVKV